MSQLSLLCRLSLLSRLSWSSQLAWLSRLSQSSQLSRLTAGISGTTGADCNKVHQKSHKTTRKICCSEGELTARVSRTTGTILLVQFAAFPGCPGYLNCLGNLGCPGCPCCPGCPGRRCCPSSLDCLCKWHQTTLFSQAALSIVMDLFYPLLLPNGMTLVLTYVVSNPLVLLKKLYFPFTMCLVLTLLMVLLLIDLMQFFSTLVYI